MSAPELHLRPLLAEHVRLRADPVEGHPVLLFPEGMLILNETAHEIVRRCDGRTSVAELLQILAEDFTVEEDVLRHDVLHNLEELRTRNLLLFSE